MEHLQRLPLRARLIAIMLVLLILALSLTAAATAYLMNRDLTQRVDDTLRRNGTFVANRALQDWLGAGDGGPSINEYAVSFYDATSGMHLRTRQANDAPDLPAPTTLPAKDPRVLSRKPFTLESKQGDVKWRAVARLTRDGSATLIVAKPLTDLRHTVTYLLQFIAFLGLGMSLACAVIGWFATSRAFRPLTRIEQTAAAIATGNLSERVPERAMPEEVASLSASLNTMLSQVEKSFQVREASEERMRQFVADASHELRTPLATVRGYAELYRQGAVPPSGIPETMNRIETQAARMSHLVDDLLLLARLDEERPLEKGLLDVTVVAAEQVQNARVRDPERRISLQGKDRALAPVMVDGDEQALHQMLGNLLTNAIRHTPSGTPIEVAVGTAEDGALAVIEVRDHGAGIDEATARRVFERFFRADKARSRASGGTGLGLAIVAAIAARHHGRVGIAETAGGGATFVVQLPTANSQAGPSSP